MRKKKDILYFMTLAVLLLAAVPPWRLFAADDAPRWFKGQLHTHTYWSDGRGFPEQAVEAYQQRGYDFLCLSDHNSFAEDPNTWKKVQPEEGPWPPAVKQSIFDSYVASCGKDAVETKSEDGAFFVRLKTYAEVKARYEQPGRFILIPAVELTQTQDTHHVHLNYTNLPMILPCIQNSSLIHEVKEVPGVSELIALNAAQTAQTAARLQRPAILMLNHPFWRYYDILPQNLLDCPDIRFFEVCNGGSEFPPCPQAPAYNAEQFWDAVNAFRSLRSQPLLFGVGSDDAHYYDAERIDGVSGVDDAWVMVRAASLTPQALLTAMNQGDFYATCGVLLDEVSFIPADRTLHVKVKAEPDTHYRIHFITTKKNFDQTVTTVESPAEGNRPARTLPIYSPTIGAVVQTVEGVEAAYQMTDGDLYVRARIESDRPAKTTPPFHPTVQTAWTQPYGPSPK